MNNDTEEFDDNDPSKHKRTLKWPKETDALAVELAHKRGFTRKGRTHINEFLQKLVENERDHPKIPLDESIAGLEHMISLAEKQEDNFVKKMRKTK